MVLRGLRDSDEVEALHQGPIARAGAGGLMVLDINLPKKPLLWYTQDQYEARERGKATWLSVPKGVTLEECCKLIDEDPLTWELAKGSYLMGFVEYRRKVDD